MKYFSALIVFAILFASLSVAYADVAPYPRPRPHHEVTQTQIVTTSIDNLGKLSMKFTFPAACDYEYQLVDRQTGVALKSGKGAYQNNAVEDVADLSDRLGNEKNYFVLKIQMSNVQFKTRFGIKILSDKSIVTKTILVEKSSQNETYSLQIYDGDVD